ncbi:ABC transporter ATP-binding protein/permease [Spiroplasma endosymbiont of Aspidapion aeneum]|uniref:ABC transporter ATP-binding protein n=1 Tax=Spiroplasma endosymbiont of Aspidapion aeneum TaxID=3066276 RepID=UPI00313D7F04
MQADEIFEYNQQRRTHQLIFLVMNSLIKKWYLTIPTFFFATITVILLVENIYITNKISALLISQNFADVFKDKQSLAKILLSGSVIDPIKFDKYYSQIISHGGKIGANTVQELVQRYYYSDVTIQDVNGNWYLRAPINIFGTTCNFTAKQYSALIAVDLCFVIVSTYLTYLMTSILSETEKARYKNRLIAKIIDQDIHYINHNKISNLISTVVEHTETFANNLRLAPVLFYQATLTFILSSLIMLDIDSYMSFIIGGLLVGIVGIVGIVLLVKKYATRSIVKSKHKGDTYIAEKLKSMTLVKSSGSWIRETKFLRTLNRNISIKTKKNLPLTELLSAATIGGIGTFVMSSIIIGIFNYINDIKTLLSVMTSFTTASLVITLPILQLNAVFPELQKSEIAACEMDRILRSKISISKKGGIEFKTLKKSIQMKNISFAYPDKPNEYYIENLSFNFEKGKRYAFIGRTGSGKSSIAKLLLRFYDPSKGKVLIDGINLKEYELKSWLWKVGYVEQEPQILSGSIYENIRYVKQDVTDEQIENACKKAKIHDFILSLPDQYNTVLFEGGAQLSGGQKQRLVIARIFVKDPEVLILDEPTSALDNIVESEIQEELEKLMVGRTTIAIAHRLNTIKNFDQIYMLDYKKGVVKQGTFEQMSKLT